MKKKAHAQHDLPPRRKTKAELLCGVAAFPPIFCRLANTSVQHIAGAHRPGATGTGIAPPKSCTANASQATKKANAQAEAT